jgi:magnesium transporter
MVYHSQNFIVMRFELTREYLDNLQQIIDNKDDKAALEILNDLHPADIAEIYSEISLEDAQYLFLLLDPDIASDVLVEIEENDRERFLNALPSEIIASQFIEEMDSDDAADIMSELSEDKRDEVLSFIKDHEQAGDIVDLMHYDEDSAGGLMAKELIAINENLSVKEALGELRDQAEDIDEIYYLYVVDDNLKLKGTVSLKNLFFSKTNAKITTLCDSDVMVVRTDTGSEEVAQIMGKYDIVALPVVDSLHRLVGRITIDDVVDVIREEAEHDYQLLSGITEDVDAHDNISRQVRSRIPWLLIGLFGGIMGAIVIGIFEGDLMKYAGLALFLPLIAAMGGNAGVQSSAIVVQGLASGDIDLQRTGKRVFKEFMVGVINGAICAVLIFIYNFFFADSYALTFSVSIALFSVVIFATMFGTFVPLLLNKYKIDPALATGPFITTANDIIGLFMYLIIARAIFNLI